MYIIWRASFDVTATPEFSFSKNSQRTGWQTASLSGLVLIKPSDIEILLMHAIGQILNFKYIIDQIDKKCKISFQIDQ